MSKKLPFQRFNAFSALKRIARVLGSLILFLFTSFSLHGQAYLLADIDDGEELSYNEYSLLTARTSRLYFVVNGNQLWTSRHGTDPADDLRLVKSFARISNLTAVGNTLYFTADNGKTGMELWKTTETGTFPVKDIHVGASGSNPENLTAVGNTLYFVASNGAYGKEVWKTNGTAAGTMLVKDVFPKGGGSNPTSLTNVNGVLFFSANDGTNGYELWKSDGTAEGTALVKDIKPGFRVSSSPAKFVNVNGTLFFVASETTTGRELWKSNGTSESTVLVKDIWSGTRPSSIDNGTAVDDVLFFTATDGVHGQELWKSDGTSTGTMLVKDMTPGSAGSHGESLFQFKMANFTNIHGTLFYTAYRNNDYFIWKSDGTTAGTVTILPCSGPGISQPKPQFTFLNGRLYFFNGTAEEHDPLDLVSMSFSNGNVSDLQYVASFAQEDAYNTYYPEMVRVMEHLYISGRPDFWYGFKLVKTDGTVDGTGWLDAYTPTEGSDPSGFVSYNGRVYFKAGDPHYQQDALWSTDGNTRGTRELFSYGSEIGELELAGNQLFASVSDYLFQLYRTDLNTGMTESLIDDNNKSSAKFLTNVSGMLYFTNDEGELWRSDGTVRGTRILKDFYRIESMDAVAGRLMFRVVYEDFTEELWRSNGTLAGTFKLKTLHTGQVRSSRYSPTAAIGNTYYFVANDGVYGAELWKSSGTASSTVMVTDLRQEQPGERMEYDLRTFTVFQDVLYFSAQDADGEWGLFKSNGTNAGTVKVGNMQPAAHMIAGPDKLFMFVERLDDASKVDLWISDGTSAGTRVLSEINSMYGAFDHEFINDVLYFVTAEGAPLWRTDGTSCNTLPTRVSRGAFPMASINTTLVFGSYHPDFGNEPHAYNPTNEPWYSCDEAVAEVAPTYLMKENQQVMTAYPNPFTNDFALRVEDDGEGTAEVRVFTLAGDPVEKIEKLNVNTDHTLGGAWPPGIYLVKVHNGDKISTYTVVKK